MDLFEQKIRSYISITKLEMNEVISAFAPKKVKKGELIIKEDTICKDYYFLESGLLRFVYHGAEIEETSWVLFEGSFFTEMVSLKSKKPTKMSLEALEPSILLSINESDLNELCEKVKHFEKYLRLTWEENLYQLLQMKLLQQFTNAKERYELLIKDKRFSQRIPQKYLASILGITPYSLSRLRNPKNS
ncbi:MAG TPA: Crp/Fnr family transcriptional regulator [Bacteroidia bacterium]|jgi:CRP-like cAMP-binding protein|nr:Crp/Fnr family transcriptional regulator [Bacteroidia bacterium]